MRVCRYNYDGEICMGFYHDEYVVPLKDLANLAGSSAPDLQLLAAVADLLDLLPHGACNNSAQNLYAWACAHTDDCKRIALPRNTVQLLRPLETPGKVLLLAGNYAAHVRESGDVAQEQKHTFPYVFMKPQTTYNDPDAPIIIPGVSPDHIDYECELAVVIGRRCKLVREEDALSCVAGYTVVNDISDRRYRPVPGRIERPKDVFFDWLHGKWHDGFCPMGPCITSARYVPDPQHLRITQHINGEMRQDASTENMIFPVAAVIAFISQTVTLLPGDIISTGTPEGIGMPSGRYLGHNDSLAAHIEGIGTLSNIMRRE